MSEVNIVLAKRNLKDKVAIVTESTTGVGYAIARRLGQEGVKVVISSSELESVNEAVGILVNEGITVVGCHCDLTKGDDRQRLVDLALDKFSKIDILVANAQKIDPHFGNLLDVSEETWDKLFDVNAKAGFLLTKLVVPHLSKERGSSIVYVASLGAYMPKPFAKDKGIAAYSISKTAVLGLNMAMSGTLLPKGIRVNCVAPGINITDKLFIFNRQTNLYPKHLFLPKGSTVTSTHITAALDRKRWQIKVDGV